MVLPLIVGAVARVAAGSAVRAGATRAGAGAAANSMGGRIASQAVGSMGVNALQRGHQNRQQAQQQPHPHNNPVEWAKQNPGLAATGYAMQMARSGSMADAATSQTQSLLQSTQFGSRA